MMMMMMKKMIIILTTMTMTTRRQHPLSRHCITFASVTEHPVHFRPICLNPMLVNCNMWHWLHRGRGGLFIVLKEEGGLVITGSTYCSHWLRCEHYIQRVRNSLTTQYDSALWR